VDSNPWVTTMAEIIRDFPDQGSLNINLEACHTYTDILTELKRAGESSIIVLIIILFVKRTRSIILRSVLTAR
jgi:hypothetical protein